MSKNSKFKFINAPGQLSRAEMKKLQGGNDESFGGKCTKIGNICDLFNPCGDPYCECFGGSVGICLGLQHEHPQAT